MLCLRLFFAICTSFTVLAQTTVRNSLGGRITDPAGSVAQSALLTLTNAETGAKYETVSDGEGKYLFLMQHLCRGYEVQPHCLIALAKRLH